MTFLPTHAFNQLSELLLLGQAYTRSSQWWRVPLSGNELGQSFSKQGQCSVVKGLMGHEGEQRVLCSSDSKTKCKNHSLSVLLTIHGLKTWANLPHQPQCQSPPCVGTRWHRNQTQSELKGGGLYPKPLTNDERNRRKCSLLCQHHKTVRQPMKDGAGGSSCHEDPCLTHSHSIMKMAFLQWMTFPPPCKNYCLWAS